MSWSTVPLPNRMQALVVHTRVVGNLLAEGFAWKLDENYSFARGPARSGQLDRRTGRPMSVPGEFAQEQTGLLRSAIFFQPISNYSDPWVQYKVGLNVDMSNDPDALRDYLMYIEGPRGSEVDASRYGLNKTGESNETHEFMLEHLQRHLDPYRFVVGGQR